MFDPTKPVQTRDGRKARIICTDRKHEAYPIAALVFDEDCGEEDVEFFAADGREYVGDDNDIDLVNVPEKVEGWVNILHLPDVSSEFYDTFASAAVYKSKEAADTEAADVWASRGYVRVACVRVEFEKP